MSAPVTPATASRRRFPSWKQAPASAPRPQGTVTRVRRAPRRPADYTPEARPERQFALATRLPTRGLTTAATLAGLVVLAAAIAALGIWPQPWDLLGRAVGPRFTRSVAMLRACFDLRAGATAARTADLCLVAAAAVTLAVAGMRRHRRDGKRGRANAWRAMAALLCLAAASASVPIGGLFAQIVADAGGRPAVTERTVWWLATAGGVSVVVGLWAIVPLHQRLLPAAWFALALVAWGVAATAPAVAASPWGLSRGIDAALVAPAAWLLGSATMLGATLVAARGVIREVRGEIEAPPLPVDAAGAPRAEPAERTARDTRDQGTQAAPEPVFEPVTADDESVPATERSGGGYTDGSDLEDEYASRPLSKAERKRLRKLAKSGQAA